MTFFDVANQPLFFILIGIGIAIVVAMALISAKKAYGRLQEAGYSKDQLSTVIKSSATFSVVPSISIVVGLISLSALIGLPWAWWRLSVIGAVTYEAYAATAAMQAMGYESFATASANTFGSVMYVMTVGIIFGIIFLIIAGKPIMLGYAKQGNKGTWGTVFNNCFMLAMFAALVPNYFTQNLVYILTFFTSMVIALLIGFIAKKTGAAWLNQFNLAICLILGMAMSVVYTNIFA